MALTTDNTWRDFAFKGFENILPISEQVLNAAVLFRGSLCSRDTAAGDIKPYDGTLTDRIVGWHMASGVTGNSSEPRVKSRIITGGFQARIPVTGLNSSAIATDSGKPVYATDDGTYTLTGTPGTTLRVGNVMGNTNGIVLGTDCWVAFQNMLNLIGATS